MLQAIGSVLKIICGKKTFHIMKMGKIQMMWFIEESVSK